jgi:hypothetical protein
VPKGGQRSAAHPRLTRVTGRRSHSLRRAAPRRLLATPGWFLLVAAGVALLTAAVVAPALFLRAAGDAAFREEQRTIEQDAFASTSSGIRGTWNGMLQPSARETVVGAINRLPGFGRPTVSAVGMAGNRRGTSAVAVAGDSQELATLYYRDGAVEALDPAGTAGPGVWLAREVATALGVGPGDLVGLQLVRSSTAGRRAPVRVAGVFDRVSGSALPAALPGAASVARRDLPWDPDRPGRGTPIALADIATFDRLSLAIGEETLWTADAELQPDLSPEQAAAAAQAMQRLADRAFVEFSDVATATRSAKPTPTRLQLASGLPDIVDRSRSTTAVARDQSSAFVGAGIALGAVVVCAAAVLLGRSRRRELDLMAGLGMSTAEVAALAALEAVAPVVVGATCGAAMAWVTVSGVGPPGEFRDGALAEVARRSSLAAVAALVLMAGCAGGAAWLADRRTTGGLQAARRQVPWEAALLVATVTAGIAVATTSVADRPSTPLAVAFPVLLAASVALVVLRLVRLLAGRLRQRGRPGGPLWLAAQRSRVAARETAAVALAVAVGLAVLGYALAVQRGVTEGVGDKVAAAVGARTVVDVGAQLGHKRPPRLPRSPLPDSTVVWRNQVTLPPTFGSQPILAVDTATFAAVADWGSTGRLDAGRDLLDDLDARGDGGTLPVLVAGGGGWSVGEKGVIDAWGDWQVPFTVVGAVPAFPGSEAQPGDIAVVVDAKRMFAAVPGFDPTVLRHPTGLDAGAFTAEVWSSKGSQAVRAGLENRRRPITVDGALRQEEAQTRSRLLAARWSSGYVVALGACAVLLVGAVALLLAVRLADRDRVSDVLLRRMGFTAQDLALARTWEVAGVVGSALVAALVAVAALTLVPTMVEPDVTLAPVTRPLPGLPDLGLLLLVAAAMVAGGAAVARRRAGRTDAAEVLRGNG